MKAKMTKFALSSIDGFNLWRVVLAFNAKVSPDELTDVENMVWTELFHEHMRNPGPESEERFLRIINQRWDEDGNRVDGPPLTKKPFLDPQKNLAEQIIEKAPQHNCIKALKQLLKFIEYEPSESVEQIKYHAIYPIGDDEDIALCDMFYEMRVPLGAITQYCRELLLDFKASRNTSLKDETAYSRMRGHPLYTEEARIYWYFSGYGSCDEKLNKIDYFHQMYDVFPSLQKIEINCFDGKDHKIRRDMPSDTTREVEKMVADIFTHNPHIQSLDFYWIGKDKYTATRTNPHSSKAAEMTAKYEAGKITEREWLIALEAINS